MTEILGIFAGRGSLPKILIEDCQKKDRKFVLFLLESEEYEIDYSEFNPIKLPYGAIDSFLQIARKNKVKEFVFIGAVNKPNFSEIKPDKKGAVLIAKILANKILGDDAVLKTVISFFEKEGFRIKKIDDLLDCVISQKGVLTTHKPNDDNLADIKIGIKAIKAFSDFDVGQSLIVAQRQIIAVEALEGTDQMIKRCSDLHFDYKDKAILIKMKKRRQSKKVDLPTIGVETIHNCFASNIKGIAIQANSTLVLEKEKVIESANGLGLFLIVI